MTPSRLMAGVLLLALSSSPALAADRISFSTQGQIRVLDTESGDQAVLNALGRATDWSPDGQQVAYVDETGIWIAAADGATDPVRVVEDTEVNTVEFSPNGLHLAYDRTAPESSIHVATLYDTEFSADVEIDYAGPGFRDEAPRWSPDGQAIAYLRLDRRTGSSDLRVFELHPNFPGSYGSPRVLLERDEWTTWSAPAWTPDGSSVIVEALPRADLVPAGFRLIRVPADGSGVQTLVAPGPDVRMHSPFVSPDGRRVAYQQPGLAESIRVLELEGNSQSFGLAAGPGRDDLIGWTAGGTRLVFQSIFDDSGCHCELVTLLDVEVEVGSEPRRLAGIDAADGEFLTGPLEPDISPGVTQRIAGQSRVETALQISRVAFEDAPAVVIARQDVYADALAGAALAGSLEAPLLLTPSDFIPETLVYEIQRLGARDVVLLGDETAISAGIEERLQFDVDRGELDSVDRISGVNRYQTAGLVTARLNGDHAFVVQGASADPRRGWPDAVAVGGLAAQRADPILLVEQDRLPEETVLAIEVAGLERVTIVGGPAAVSEQTEDAIRALGVDVERIGGATRFQTSQAVAELSSEDGADSGRTWFATGGNWPDSLAAGPAAAHTGGVLLLVDGLGPDGATGQSVWLNNHDVHSGVIVGSPDVISGPVRQQIEFQGPCRLPPGSCRT